MLMMKKLEKDLQSNFIWTSDTNDQIKDQTFHYDDQNNINQQISLNDEINKEFVYDIDNINQHLWNINTQDNENKQNIIQLNLNENKTKQSFDTTINQNKKQIFIQGEDFTHQIIISQLFYFIFFILFRLNLE